MNMRSLAFSLLMGAATAAGAAGWDADTCAVCGAGAAAGREGAHAVVVAAAADTSARGSLLTRYDRRVHRYRLQWQSLIPTQTVVQFAGNMGLLSFGVGWEYGRHKQWETHLLFGFLPRYGSDRAKVTMTLKENFIPWSIYLKRGWAVEPLSVGLYFNTVFGPEFWRSLPARYPDSYYPFLSTKVRVNVFAGQRVELVLPSNRRKFVKSITAFYELSTCDLYLRALVQDGSVSLCDIFGLSLGLKFQLF